MTLYVHSKQHVMWGNELNPKFQMFIYLQVYIFFKSCQLYINTSLKMKYKYKKD